VSDQFVIDASVAIKLVVPEEHSIQAVSLRSKYRLAAPDILFSECANTLWKKVRRGELSDIDACEAMDILTKMDLDVLPCRDLSQEALLVSLRLDHPAYDCIYLCAALRLETVVMTADERLLRKLGQSGPEWTTLAKSVQSFGLGE
jgi:predicted nucleic acid-binding protein